MSLSQRVKAAAISLGLYRPARWLTRVMHPSHRERLDADVALYRALVASGALAFDVGANIGEKSEALLRAGARVVAFEPNPIVLPELRARCAHSKKWTVVAAAVGSAAGRATFHARESIVNSGLGAEGESPVIATYEVPVVTLDAAIERFGCPSFCKIDVEGWEFEVLRGLSRPISLLSFEFQLSQRGIQKTRSCLERLAEGGDGHVNLTPAESARFHFDHWFRLSDFIDWFPGDLRATLPGDHYGDIYVSRQEPPALAPC